MKKTKSHPLSDLMMETDWPEFVTTLAARMRRGSDTYGDSSLTLEPLELVKELEQECLDICGWGSLLWRRLRQIRRVLEEAANK